MAWGREVGGYEEFYWKLRVSILLQYLLPPFPPPTPNEMVAKQLSVGGGTKILNMLLILISFSTLFSVQDPFPAPF